MNQAIDQGEAILPYKFMQPAAAQVAKTDHHRTYHDVEFAILAGFRPLVLDLTIPLDQRGPVPIVVYIHPGAWLTGSHKSTGVYRNMAPIQTSLLAAGFAVASVQYRLAAEALFPACLHDVTAAVRWLRYFAPELGLDPNRLGTWGESCGGHLSTFLALNLTDETLIGSVGVTGVSSAVRAAVSWYPPIDFLAMHEQAVPGTKADHNAPDSPESRLIGAGLLAAPERARQASPLTWANAAAAPLLLVHGEDDHIVPPQQSQTMQQALQALGTQVHCTLVADADHQLAGVDTAPYLVQSVAFLRQQLQH